MLARGIALPVIVAPLQAGDGNGGGSATEIVVGDSTSTALTKIGIGTAASCC
jgi:hypothetical protein